MIKKTLGVEPWKIEEIRRHLQERFPENEIDCFARGQHAAHLFLVLKADPREKNRVVHQLLITKRFFDRFTDQGSLATALAAGEVVLRMIQASDRTVELY